MAKVGERDKPAEGYDVFLCFKQLREDGEPTRDSILARDIHRFLSSRGVSVFHSTVELEARGVSAFKKAIDQALDASRVLVAIGTTAEHLESEWVRYEWDSFFNDVISGVKPDGRVFAYIESLEFKSLPRALRQSQAILHRDGSFDLLYRFIANALELTTVTERPIDRYRAEFEPLTQVESIIKRIDSIIHDLANFHSNPEGIYYIGQTLIECDVFLDDHGINDKASELITDLIDEIDNDERRKEGLFDPIVSVGKVRHLIRRLRLIRGRFLEPQNATEQIVGRERRKRVSHHDSSGDA